uniref:Uncharacterized protein n=4 Tax=Avena sativa TaxID=4498 RepID=A0ACD5XN99_AVESA
MAETGHASRLPTSLDVLASDVQSKLEFHKSAYFDCLGTKNMLDCVIEEKGKLQQEQNAIIQVVAEKDSLTKKNEELAAEIESLKEQLRASVSSNPLQGSGFQQSQSGRAQTGPMQKRKRQSGDKDADENEGARNEVAIMEDLSGMENPDQGLSTEHEGARKEIADIHSKLIKGFIDISDTGGRNISIKNIGQLDERLFLPACLEKLPRKEAEKKSSELYHFWQEQLLNPEWNPFKTDTVEGITKEIVDVNDDKLQELCAAWGDGVYKAVVSCLMEIQENGRLGDRSIVPELWNFKAKRKATLSESVEYMCSQVKRLTDASRRTRSRRAT